MGVELSDAELDVMGAVWDAGGEAAAIDVCKAFESKAGASRSATYTLIYRCIKKGALERVDPGFVCRAKVSRDQMQDEQTNRLADKLFEGSLDNLFAALVDRKKVSVRALERARAALDEYGTRFDD